MHMLSTILCSLSVGQNDPKLSRLWGSQWMLKAFCKTSCSRQLQSVRLWKELLPGFNVFFGLSSWE